MPYRAAVQNSYKYTQVGNRLCRLDTDEESTRSLRSVQGYARR
jgi:hypothetical protein